MKFHSERPTGVQRSRASEALFLESDQQTVPDFIPGLEKKALQIVEQAISQFTSGETIRLGWASVFLGDNIRQMLESKKSFTLSAAYGNSWLTEFLVMLYWMYPEEIDELNSYPAIGWFEKEPKDPVAVISGAFDRYVLYTGNDRLQAMNLERAKAGIAKWLVQLKLHGTPKLFSEDLYYMPKVLLLFPELRPTLLQLFQPILDLVGSHKSEFDIQSRIGLSMLMGEIKLTLNAQGIPEMERDSLALPKKIDLPERSNV